MYMKTELNTGPVDRVPIVACEQRQNPRNCRNEHNLTEARGQLLVCRPMAVLQLPLPLGRLDCVMRNFAYLIPLQSARR